MIGFLRKIIRLVCRVKVFGYEHTAKPGPLLLLLNHPSIFDWIIIDAVLDRRWKFAFPRYTREPQWLRKYLSWAGRLLLIDTYSIEGARSVVNFIRRGGCLMIFAEGRINPTNCPQKFLDGIGFVLQNTRASVIFGVIRGLGLQFRSGRVFRSLFPIVQLHFSRPETEYSKPHTSKKADARRQICDSLHQLWTEHYFQVEMQYGPSHLVEAFCATVRRCGHQVGVEDHTFQRLTYRRLAASAHALGSAIKPKLVEEEKIVGLLLPTSNAAVVSLIALWSIDRCPAILNFTMGSSCMRTCLDSVRVKTVITSRTFVQRVGLDEDIKAFEEGGVQILYLEDLRAEIGLVRFLISFIRHWLRPFTLWEQLRARRPGRSSEQWSQEPAAIVFTSGSEGQPKAVELTHRNLLANVRQVLSVIPVRNDDILFNALPVFHSFGLTIGICAGLVRGLRTFQYPSPLHYKQVPMLVYDTQSTIFISTNTFLLGYAAQAHPVDFTSIRYLFAGAEKVQPSTARLWADYFGVRVLEGYGVTECSPVVSVNRPNAIRQGSVGRLLPGMQCRIEPVPGICRGGRLWLKGPNVMKRYLDEKIGRESYLWEGWYDTGDIAWLDEDGFLYIEGRLKRFAKIGGEMVSLTAVEEALSTLLREQGLEFPEIVVVSVTDSRRGEQIVAVTSNKALTLESVRDYFRRRNLPMLWVPQRILYVDKIPRFGTGKPAYPLVKALVEEQLRCKGD